MAAIAEFRLDAEDFPLGTVFADLPDAIIELERVVPTNAYVIPYFWMHGAAIENVESMFADHAGIDRVELVDAVDDEYLVRVDWSTEVDGVLSAIGEMDVALLSGVGTAEEWRFEIRGADRDAIAAFQSYCHDHGIPCELTALHDLTSAHTGPEYELTDKQREALLLAFERGYYETPREATLQTIAEKLGISRQAVASRLRRGTAQLIASTLARPGKSS